MAIESQPPRPIRRPPTTGIVVVDHGSRRTESNETLLKAVAAFQAAAAWPIVEPAHMELAEPTIAQAFARCVEQGAQRVVVFPYFLSPGRHWSEDIPRLAAEASSQCGGVEYLVTAPLGLHPLIPQIIGDRIEHCLRHAANAAAPCDVCEPGPGCQLYTTGSGPDAVS